MKRRLLFSTFACLILFNVLLGVRFTPPTPPSAEDDSGYSQIAVLCESGVQLCAQGYVTREDQLRRPDLRRDEGRSRRLNQPTSFMDPTFKEMQDDTRTLQVWLEVAVKAGCSP